jgi:hypothetical protein
MRGQEPPTTIVIIGADTVVGSVLCALLGGHGYRTTPIDAHPTGVVDGLLEGTDLLLLPAPRLDRGMREAFLGRHGQEHSANGRYAGDRALHGRGGGSLPEKEEKSGCRGRARQRPSWNASRPALAGESPEGAVAV